MAYFTFSTRFENMASADEDTEKKLKEVYEELTEGVKYKVRRATTWRCKKCRDPEPEEWTDWKPEERTIPRFEFVKRQKGASAERSLGYLRRRGERREHFLYVAGEKKWKVYRDPSVQRR